MNNEYDTERELRARCFAMAEHHSHGIHDQLTNAELIYGFVSKQPSTGEEPTTDEADRAEEEEIIRQVQDAPTRRYHYVDVGDMTKDAVAEAIENIKKEIHQRRVPGYNNLLSILDDYFPKNTSDAAAAFMKNMAESFKKPK